MSYSYDMHETLGALLNELSYAMFKPLNGRIFVELEKVVEAQTTSGILLSKGKKIDAEGKLESETESDCGIVVCGGELAKKGDKVYFSKYAADKIIYDPLKEPMYAVSEAGLIAVLTQ